MPFRRLPPLLALRAFEAVARLGSFKQAADELSVTPGAVSQQVKKLEADMGATLLRACALYAAHGFELVSSRPVTSFSVDLVEQEWARDLRD